MAQEQERDTVIQKYVATNYYNPKKRSHVSNPKLAAMTSNLERILRKRASPWFEMNFRWTELRSKAVHEPVNSLKASLESDTESFLFNFTSIQVLPSAVNAFIHYPCITREVRITLLKMAEMNKTRLLRTDRPIDTEGDRRITVKHLLCCTGGNKYRTQKSIVYLCWILNYVKDIKRLFERHIRTHHRMLDTVMFVHFHFFSKCLKLFTLRATGCEVNLQKIERSKWNYRAKEEKDQNCLEKAGVPAIFV